VAEDAGTDLVAGEFKFESPTAENGPEVAFFAGNESVRTEFAQARQVARAEASDGDIVAMHERDWSIGGELPVRGLVVENDGKSTVDQALEARCLNADSRNDAVDAAGHCRANCLRGDAARSRTGRIGQELDVHWMAGVDMLEDSDEAFPHRNAG